MLVFSPLRLVDKAKGCHHPIKVETRQLVELELGNGLTAEKV